MITCMVERDVVTKRGTIKLVRDFEPGYIADLQMGEVLGIFFHYRYEDAHKTKELLSTLSGCGDQRIACAVSSKDLVGYVTVVATEQGSRWRTIEEALEGSAEGLTRPLLMELGSIEISKPWRSQGIARLLLEFMFGDPFFEDRIVFSRELSWHWDLKASGLSSYEYRSMLMRLFEGVGFRYCETDDEEIHYAGENMLMVRVGSSVPAETALVFYRSVCRSEPRGWGWG
jgi:GNAT superfamily N-acetyltransferase